MNSTKQKGLFTEINCELAFTEVGIALSKPLGEDSRYDYIADVNGNLLRIQCKTASVGKDGDYIEFSCRSTQVNTLESVHREYSKDEIDYFYTYFQGISYLVPVEECSSTKKLRFIPPKNGQTIGINFCEDYELLTVLAKKYNFEPNFVDINVINKKNDYTNKCIDCGAPITSRAMRCRKCNDIFKKGKNFVNGGYVQI